MEMGKQELSIDPPDFITQSEMARIAGTDVETFRRRMREKGIAADGRIGDSFLFRIERVGEIKSECQKAQLPAPKTKAARPIRDWGALAALVTEWASKARIAELVAPRIGLRPI